jgi:hypothetical protein
MTVTNKNKNNNNSAKMNLFDSPLMSGPYKSATCFTMNEVIDLVIVILIGCFFVCLAH